MIHTFQPKLSPSQIRRYKQSSGNGCGHNPEVFNNPEAYVPSVTIPNVVNDGVFALGKSGKPFPKPIQESFQRIGQRIPNHLFGLFKMRFGHAKRSEAREACCSVLGAFIALMDLRTLTSRISIDDLANYCSMSRVRVINAVANLRIAGLICDVTIEIHGRKRARGSKKRYINIHRITDRAFEVLGTSRLVKTGRQYKRNSERKKIVKSVADEVKTAEAMEIAPRYAGKVTLSKSEITNEALIEYYRDPTIKTARDAINAALRTVSS